MEEIFGSNGLIAKYHDNYEHRDGQIKMADAVMNAFDEQRNLIVEAGTGTGKTLAYLVPAIAAALGKGQKIVISTGTKNLQEQLMEKDIPFLQRFMPKKFKVANMKGRANYACLHRIKRAEDQPILEGMDQLDQFDQIRHWVRDTETGDRAELIDLPENLPYWGQLNAKGETCLGQKCSDFETCFVTRMRTRAADADIVIVNHHLFFADLNIRGNEFGKVLPDYAAVIFDEAHLVEDIASDYFGFQVSSYQVDELVRDAVKLPITDVLINRELTKNCGKISSFADSLWSSFQQGRGYDGRFPLLQNAFAYPNKRGEIETTPAGDAYFALDAALDQLEKMFKNHSPDDTDIESVVRRTRQLRFELDFIVSQTEKNFVYWMERRGRGMFLRSSPIDVSGLLREKLFDKLETVVMTSATMSTNGKFDFIRDRLGFPPEKTDVLLAPSSFDYQKQTILYLPKTMPEPRSPEFTEMAANEIVNILKVTKGRAFILATSNSSMKALYELVSVRVNFPCFVQGTMSKAGVLDKFRHTENSVLFATSSFWQGVDVRGEQLSCVIIDKLPFAVPSDPIVAARTKFIDENGGKSFFDYSVPNAVITLKQGVGRLIRSATDKGVIAILDSRLRTKGYSKEFLNSLPKCRITGDLSEVEDLLK
jgi:ATP-dependent DNA helicase DinG